MNIAIVESISRSNEESKMILKSTQEQSLKRRTQLNDYSTFKEYSPTQSKGLMSRLIEMIKTNWYC